MHYLSITDNVCAWANAHFQHRQMHFQSRFFLNLRGFAVRVFSELLTGLKMMSPSSRNGYMHHCNYRNLRFAFSVNFSPDSKWCLPLAGTATCTTATTTTTSGWWITTGLLCCNAARLFYFGKKTSLTIDKKTSPKSDDSWPTSNWRNRSISIQFAFRFSFHSA